MEEDFWGIEAEPPFSFFVRLKVRVASFIVVRHGVVRLAMEGAVGFATEVGVFQRVGAGLSAVGRSAGNEDCVVAFVYKALIEEGGEYRSQVGVGLGGAETVMQTLALLSCISGC